MARRRLLIVVTALVAVIAVAGVAKREEISRLLAVNTLFEPDQIVYNFSHMGTMFDTVPMPLPPHAPDPLPVSPRPATLPDDIPAWVAERGITSLVVLRRGEIVFEDYYQGTGRDDLRVSWSVAKSFLATLIGLSVEDGAIASLDDPVTKYVPMLEGSAYDGATIRNVLNMASGVAFNEDYADYWSDINRMGRVIALGRSLDDFAASLTERRAEPGTEFHYVSIDTHVLGMVLRGATGRSVPELMQERLFAPLKLDVDPYFLADGTGTAFVLGGLNMTARDYAKFGQMILQDGRWEGTEIVPTNWVREMTAESAPGKVPRYGYQWWLPDDGAPGEVFARGLHGQYIWIDRTAGVVVAVNAADLNFLEPGVHEDNIEKMRSIVEAVR